MKFKVDMIRISVLVPVLKFRMFERRYLKNNYYVKSYISNKPSGYQFNYSVNEVFESFSPFDDDDLSEGAIMSYYFGYRHNQEAKPLEFKTRFSFVLEYNPNKCIIDYGLLFKILHYFFNDVSIIRLHSCDVCCDFVGLSINNVFIAKEGKHKFVDYQEGGGRTLYVGKRGSHGQVKVYDKAQEMGVGGLLTRWEGHFCFDDLYFNRILARGFQIEECLPTAFFDGGQLNMIDDPKLRAALFAIQSGYMTIDDFKRDFREKIKQHLRGTVSVEIGNAELPLIRNCIIDYVTDFFNLLIRCKN